MKTHSMQSNILWNAAGNLIYLGCQWLVTVLVTVIGGLTDAGLLSVAMSVSATFQTLAMFGIRNYQVSDIQGKYKNDTYVGFRMLACAGALLVCMIFSLISGYLGGQLLAIALFMAFRLIEAISDVLHGILQKENRLDIAGKSFAMKGIGLLIVFLASYWLTRQLCIGLLCLALYAACITFLYDLPSARRLTSFRLWDHPARSLRLALETLPLCIYTFLYVALSTVPKLTLEKLSGEVILGAYSSVFAPAMLLQAATGNLYCPFATQMADDCQNGRIRRFWALLGKLSVALVGIFAVVVVLAELFGDFALVLVFGEQIREYTYLLTPILFVNLVISFLGLISMVMVVVRSFRWLLGGYAVGFVMEILISPVFIRRFGADGASYALILAGCLAMLIHLVGLFLTVRHMGKQTTSDE